VAVKSLEKNQEHKKHHLGHVLLQDSLKPLPLVERDIGLDRSLLWLKTAPARNYPSSCPRLLPQKKLGED